jgi:hypothetical protein
MRHFHRTSLSPVDVMNEADRHFGALGLTRVSAESHTRQFSGPLGSMSLSVRMEGGHYTMVEASTDQVGESRLDKNVKKFFVALHRAADPRHRIEAGY